MCPENNSETLTQLLWPAASLLRPDVDPQLTVSPIPAAPTPSGAEAGAGYPIPAAVSIPDVNMGDKWATISAIRCRHGRFIR